MMRFDQTAMKRLLILSCSQRKHPSRRPMPAVARYDGAAFQVLKKYLRTTHDPSLRVFILSAKYGVIDGDAPIADYDQKMTPERADALKTPSQSIARNAVRRGRYSEVF